MVHFEAKNLTFSYTSAKMPALLDVNLAVEQGQYLTLCGRSGSGKTTLLRHLKGVLTPHGIRTGDLLFEGRPLAEVDLREQSSKIGYVMQNPDNQLVTDKVWHELAFGLESLGLDQRTIRLRVAEMSSFFGIEAWFHKSVSELSGGQKQLLNLASIMAMQPTALILDEPTAQLDPIAAADFLATVHRINRELGTTVILSEHRLEEVFPCSDRVVVMAGGRIVADDTPRGIGAQLRHEQSDMLLSLPAPMQIFYGAENVTASATVPLPCPLTVREGRGWLTARLDGVALQADSLGELPPPHEPSDIAVELKEVWFRYQKEQSDVLKGVSLRIPRGELFAVVGGNGTGKSTMLKTICGICTPYRGRVIINDPPVAMLPQDPQSLFVKKTVAEDMGEMLARGRYSAHEKQALLTRVATDCEITELMDCHPYDLSGGEQQRAALAKVLLCSPKVILLDEPTKGLDNLFKVQLAKVLGRLKADGTTIILVSHDIEFCARYADSVAMFFDGGVVTTNTPTRFFSQNSFYTTGANRMSRHIFKNAITVEEVIELCQTNLPPRQPAEL